MPSFRRRGCTWTFRRRSPNLSTSMRRRPPICAASFNARNAPSRNCAPCTASSPPLPARGSAKNNLAKESNMPNLSYKTALIVGAGSGLSASLARLFSREGLRVALAARNSEKLGGLCAETGAKAFGCDATNPGQVAQMFAAVEAATGAPDVVVYNASARARGPVAELVPAEDERALMVSAYGGFLVAREATARMLPKKHGAVLFTGASASVKGCPS